MGILNMSKYRQAAKVDSNQSEIVKQLRQAGAEVLTGHDDILVYFRDKLFQIEIKEQSPFNKNGTFRKGYIKESQLKLLANLNDKYAICWTIEQCLQLITGQDGDYITPSKYLANWQVWHKDRITPEQKAQIHFAKWAEGL
jgi:hypothetical protein